MELQETVDQISICRICMQGSVQLHPIFDNFHLSDCGTNTIADIITECTKYPVLYNDKLPTKICSPCMESARNAHLFKKQTEEAYCRLKALYDISWVPKKEKGSTHSSTTSFIDKYTQTDKSSVFQCESCPKKFFAENELRQHRATSHIYDGKKCRVCGEKFNHLGQLKIHLSTEHPDEGIRCDFKCEVCQREFTRKDHLKRHLARVHKILDEKLNIAKVPLDEPEIHIVNPASASASLNNYSSHWPEYQEEENQTPECGLSLPTNNNLKATNPFSSDEGDLTDHHDFDDMNEADVKQFVETLTHPEISIKVERSDCSDNHAIEKQPSLSENLLGETKVNLTVAKQEFLETERFTVLDSENVADEFHDAMLEDDQHSDDPTSEDEDEEDAEAEEDDNLEDLKSPPNLLNTKCVQKQKKIRNKTSKSKAPRRNHGFSKTEDNSCKVCNRSFSRFNHLQRHMLTHSDEKPHICSFCSKGFSRSDHLQKHIQSIHCEKNFKCDQCDSAYGRKDHLQRHIETRHNKNPAIQKPQFECDMCEKKFTTKTYLARHKLLHTDRLYACKHCPETFQEKEQMKEHQKKEHSQPRNFLCSICGDSFQRNEYLKIHMRRHTGEKPYKCRFCEKGFPRSTDLKMHERYHIGLKPNLCNLCGKGFHRPYNLTIHMRTHTGEKPYKCNQCPQAFAQSNDLKAHIRRHTGERFRCDMCSAPFLQRYGLNAHLRTVHGIIVTSFTGRLRKTDQSAEDCEMHQEVAASDVDVSAPSMLLEQQQPNVTSLDPTLGVLAPQHALP